MLDPATRARTAYSSGIPEFVPVSNGSIKKNPKIPQG